MLFLPWLFGRIHNETIWIESFLFWKVFDYIFNFFNRYRTKSIFCLICVDFGKLYFSRNLSILSKLSEFWYTFFIVLSYYLFNVCRICSDNLPVLLILVIYVVFFLDLRIFQFCWYCQIISFWLSYFSLLFFFFKVFSRFWTENTFFHSWIKYISLIYNWEDLTSPV